jgi:acetylornithine aminotransferase
MLGTTFGGAHLACAASLAVLEVMEQESLIENAHNMGEYMMASLKEFEGIVEIRGQGLMIGLEFEFPVAALRKQLMFEEKVFTGSASDKNVMRLLPPLCIGKKEADRFVESLHVSIKKTLSKSS